MEPSDERLEAAGKALYHRESNIASGWACLSKECQQDFIERAYILSQVHQLEYTRAKLVEAGETVAKAETEIERLKKQILSLVTTAQITEDRLWCTALLRVENRETGRKTCDVELLLETVAKLRKEKV